MAWVAFASCLIPSHRITANRAEALSSPDLCCLLLGFLHLSLGSGNVHVLLLCGRLMGLRVPLRDEFARLRIAIYNLLGCHDAISQTIVAVAERGTTILLTG